LLLHSADEGFVSVELLLLNTLDLTAELYKAAGSVTYLIRGEMVQKIEKESLPLGILRGFQTTKQLINLRPQDRLLLLTDGLAEAKINWTEVLLHLPIDAQDALKYIFSQAQDNYDDQSAVLIDIWSIKQDGS